MHLAFGHGGHEAGIGVEPDELHFARELAVLEGDEHPLVVGLADGEDAIDLFDRVED